MLTTFLTHCLGVKHNYSVGTLLGYSCIIRTIPYFLQIYMYIRYQRDVRDRQGAGGIHACVTFPS